MKQSHYLRDRKQFKSAFERQGPTMNTVSYEVLTLAEEYYLMIKHFKDNRSFISTMVFHFTQRLGKAVLPSDKQKITSMRSNFLSILELSTNPPPFTLEEYEKCVLQYIYLNHWKHFTETNSEIAL